MVTGTGDRDGITVFESQPGEAARAAQMFPLSVWQRPCQEDNSREERSLPESSGSEGEAAALTQWPSRFHMVPLANPRPTYDVPRDGRPWDQSDPQTFLGCRLPAPGWLLWHSSVCVTQSLSTEPRGQTCVCNPGKRSIYSLWLPRGGPRTGALKIRVLWKERLVCQN
jgi:hypothetical protein